VLGDRKVIRNPLLHIALTVIGHSPFFRKKINSRANGNLETIENKQLIKTLVRIVERHLRKKTALNLTFCQERSLSLK
jgi:phenylacetate-coenzyme A ligase PaaK-like adenylate-forming protein